MAEARFLDRTGMALLTGFWTMAPLRYAAKRDPFPFLPLEGIKFCHLATLYRRSLFIFAIFSGMQKQKREEFFSPVTPLFLSLSLSLSLCGFTYSAHFVRSLVLSRCGRAKIAAE